MWESPNWIGSLISSKVRKESDVAARELTSDIEANKLSSQKYIAELNAQTNKSIADMNVQATRDVASANVEKDLEIARKRIQADKDIAEERNKINREIALWQVAGNVVPKALPIVLGAKVVGKDPNNRNNSNTNTTGPSTATATVKSKAEKAKEKADALFPELEPTFEITPLDRSQVPGGNKVTKIGINTALVSATIAALSSIPILGL